MALNDRLIGEGTTVWWHSEISRQLKRRRRDIEEKDERAEETEETNE